MIYDYIIIGGGISGLYTRYLLQKISPQLHVLILECTNKVGGRIFTDGKSKLGAKFLHENVDEFVSPKVEKENTYYLGNLHNQKLSKDTKTSMILEDVGSVSKKVHRDFHFTNEKNTFFDFNTLLSVFSKNANIKYNMKYKSYLIEPSGIIRINNEFKTRNLVFAVPVNTLQHIENPYKHLFNNWFQSNVITFSFELDNNLFINKTLKPGFFFNDYFKKTSFFYDEKNKIIYANIYDKNKKFSVKRAEKDIAEKLGLQSYVFKYKIWNQEENCLGGWSIPKNTLTSSIIKKIENGYENKIYYVGDYLGKVENVGSVTTSIKNVDRLVKRIFNL